MADPRLERAREHCFMGGVGDSGMSLCAANVPYGIAKIHAAQEQLGLPADATFVASPDATITRNDSRWNQGFGYGGMYAWTGDFHVLDIKANACGMAVGALPSLPSFEEVRERLHHFEHDGMTIDGVAIDNDLHESNHFVDVFTLAGDEQREPAPTGARHFFIMHSSGHEHRGPTPRGVGLYWDLSQELVRMARTIDTPWGTLRVLVGDAAREWYHFYRRVQAFNHRRREQLAGVLFGDHRMLINATHQGLVRGLNFANIGCYTFDDATPEADRLFPLTLSPTLPAFLVRGRRNLDEPTIERMGWSERVQRHGLAARLGSTNILPHGGGYTYASFRGVARVIDNGPDDRLFELAPADPAAPVEVVRSPRQLKYAYRGLEVKERMEELGFGTAVVKLDIDYVIKSSGHGHAHKHGANC